MFTKRFALFAEAGDGDGGGDGAPAGGSPEGGQDSQPGGGGDKQIPESRLRAALAQQKRELLAEFEAKLAAAPKGSQDTARTYTRAELSSLVDSGQITQAQADQQWDAQADERASRVALETVSQVERKKLVDSEIARYTAVAPEVLEDGHATRKDIQSAYNGLLELGQPKNVATQLMAIRQVLGPVDRLERSRNGRNQHDTHRETGGGGAGNGGGARTNTGKLVDRLNADAKREYEKRIDRGIYKDWDAVESELKYASAGTRQRLGIA